jgi:hypothetical protein
MMKIPPGDLNCQWYKISCAGVDSHMAVNDGRLAKGQPQMARQEPSIWMIRSDPSG